MDMPTCGNCLDFKGKASDVLAHQKKDHCSEDKRWGEVIQLNQEGKERAATTLVKKILGTYEPMSEEDKEALREYNETHKDEIKQRRELKSNIQQGLKEKLKGNRR